MGLPFGYGKGRKYSRQGVNGRAVFEGAPPCEVGSIFYKIVDRFFCGLGYKWR